MANDYISREEAKRELLTEATIINDRRFMKTDSALAVLDIIPAADVVPVVRCRNCEHFCKSFVLEKCNFEYAAYCTRRDCWTGSNDFCSSGKQREAVKVKPRRIPWEAD